MRRCSITEADQFIKAHYWPSGSAIIMSLPAAEHDGQAIGCIVYSAPPREADKRQWRKVWELARLYPCFDEIPKNAETWLIGQR